MARHISSEKARAQWRELLDTVATGEEIIIERYGRPVAVLSPYGEAATAGVREPAPVYDTAAREQLKAEIVAEVLAELEANPPEPLSWAEGLALLHKSMEDSPFAEMTTDEIVEMTRKTRQEIFEAEYAHLYR